MSRLKTSVKPVNTQPVGPIKDESTADIFISGIVCTDLTLSLSRGCSTGRGQRACEAVSLFEMLSWLSWVEDNLSNGRKNDSQLYRPKTTHHLKWTIPCQEMPLYRWRREGDKPAAVIPNPTGGKTDVYRWAAAEILTAWGIAQLWRDGTWSKGTGRMYLMWVLNRNIDACYHCCVTSFLIISSSCSGLTGASRHVYSQHSLNLISTLCFLVSLHGREGGLSDIGSLKRKIGIPRHRVIIGQFAPSWAPHQLRRWWLFQKDRNKFIASVHLCLPLELQSRRETIKARKQPLGLSSPSAFASWISFHPAAPQLCFCCQFPQFCCWLITKKIRFTVSFNKQSV